MSIQTTIQGGLVKPTVTTLTASLQVVQSAGQVGAIVAGFSAVNTTGGAVDLDLQMNDGSSDFPIFHQSVPDNDTVIVSDLALFLPSGYTLKALGSGLKFRPITFTTAQDAQPNSLS